MNKGIRFLVVSLYCCIVVLFVPISVQASDFGTSYDVSYGVSPEATTIVTQKITLTNRKTHLYPQEYSVVLDTERVDNIIAYDNGGSIQPRITQKDRKTQINLKLNEKIVGLGRETTFWIRFENKDIAKKNGAIWEINLPGLPQDDAIERYTAHLQVPPTFGQNAYMWPPPTTGMTWTRDQLTQGGVTAAYGTVQYASVALRYFLENTTILPQEKTIALPPDTQYQQVFIESLEPRPKNIVQDRDGNYLATYTLMPSQSLAIEAKIAVTLSFAPSGKTHTLSDESVYLEAQPYWEVHDPHIAALAKTYTTPQAIYDYVVSVLSYDYKRVSDAPIRKGAKQALSAPDTAICMEFTDLFIAIARAAGIPAREVVGYAYTTNSTLRPLSLVADVLHAWPEYYRRDRRMWIAVDPTWTETTGGINYFDKLDFNHVALAIHGVASDMPIAAGFYRQKGASGKTVDIQFSEHAPPLMKATARATVEFPKSVVSGAVHAGKVVLTNTSGVRTDPMVVTIQSTPVDVGITRTIDVIPPFGNVEIPFSVPLAQAALKQNGRIVATVDHEATHHIFEIQPYTYYSIVPLLGIGIIVCVLLWLSFRYIPIWKRSKHK